MTPFKVYMYSVAFITECFWESSFQKGVPYHEAPPPLLGTNGWEISWSPVVLSCNNFNDKNVSSPTVIRSS